MNDIRLLTADEINIRQSSLNKKGTKVSVLFYKDARVDMAILDEVYGRVNWQTDYKEIKDVMYCGIGVRETAINENGNHDSWVWKWNAGIESQGTGEDDDNNKKGEASDAFKRAGFLWGIGRELYNCKDIWVDLNADEIYEVGGKKKCKNLYLSVSEIAFDEKTLMPIRIIITDSDGNVRYSYGAKKAQNKPATAVSKKNEQSTKENEKKSQQAIDEPTSDVLDLEDDDMPEMSKEELEQKVKDENNTAYKYLANHVFDMLKDYDFSDLKETTKKLINAFFANTLKYGNSWAKKIELVLDSNRDKPYIQGNIVIRIADILTTLDKDVNTEIDIFEQQNK